MITVLLADDHRMVRDGLRYLLEAPGDIQIAATAANGKEAVDRALTLCPDVAVIDVSMPVMDGIEATRRLKQDQPETMVIGLSVLKRPNIGADAFALLV